MGKNNKVEKINILITFGTRPECIKLAPIIKEIENNTDRFNLTICSTGQHKEMLNQVMDFFEIKPDIFFNLMADNQSLESLSSKVLVEMNSLLTKFNLDIILIQGDTTTAFLTALAAFYKKIKIGHVEAGLRTYNKYNPFPEEINRQLISKVADLHFVPTEKSYNNLISEGIDSKGVFLTGNTIVDAIEWSINKIKKNKAKIESNDFFKEVFSDGKNKKIILVTMHRRESFGLDIENICYALKEIVDKYENVKIVYPVHLNPNVKKPVFKILSGIKNIILTEPLDYESFIWLMNLSDFIVTDSGGVQEEAPTLKKPVLVIRKFTERVESLELGISKLIGTDRDSIVKHISELLDNREIYAQMIPKSNPYGDGKASERIVKIIFDSGRLK
jgi:UDP-N-acetylglucosamine 2-epimerase (non-hydrolysing)